MRCDRIQGLLSAYGDGELPARQAARVAEHLQTCAVCAAEARSLSTLVCVLQSLPELEPPASLRSSIFAAVDQVQPTMWERLRTGLAPLQPSVSFAVGAAA